MKTDKIKKEEIITALRVKLQTELFFAAVGESFCEDLMRFVKMSPKEDFTRAEADFLVNHAISEVFFHGGREERVKLSKVLQRACWTNISDEEIGLADPKGALPRVIF